MILSEVGMINPLGDFIKARKIKTYGNENSSDHKNHSYAPHVPEEEIGSVLVCLTL